MDTRSVIKVADDVLADNYQTMPPVDVYEIARNNGLVIIEKQFPQSQAGISGFVVSAYGAGKLYVNLSDNPNRRRFTVAHELGHWKLHKQELENNPERSILFRIAIGQLNTDPVEKEANIFAANLLVPLDILEHVRSTNTPEQLAKLFDVSSDVIGYRLALLEKQHENTARKD